MRNITNPRNASMEVIRGGVVLTTPAFYR